jgi:hypothetical protein
MSKEEFWSDLANLFDLIWLYNLVDAEIKRREANGET